MFVVYVTRNRDTRQFCVYVCAFKRSQAVIYIMPYEELNISIQWKKIIINWITRYVTSAYQKYNLLNRIKSLICVNIKLMPLSHH